MKDKKKYFDLEEFGSYKKSVNISKFLKSHELPQDHR